MVRSVRARMTLWNMGVVALSLMIFGLALRYSVQQFLFGGMDRDLQERARFGPRGPGGPGPRGMPGQQGPLNVIFPWEGRRGMLGGMPGGPGFNPGGPMGPPDGRMPPGDGPMRGPGNGPGGGPPGPPPEGEGNGFRRRLGLPPLFMDLNGKDLTLHQTVAVYSEEGQRAAQTGRSLFTEGTWGDGAVRVFSAPIWRDGKIIGVVQTAAPLAETRRAMAGVTRTLLLLMPAALLLAGLGGAFLTERSLRPVREITDAARNIGASNLTARLPVRGRDEFAQLAEMLNGMLGRIEDAFSRQKRFTADASHELKTPLSIIKVSSSMALEERMTPEEYQQSLRAIDRATDRANRVVQDLLLLARSDNGSLPLHPVTLSVEDVLDEARDSLPGSGVPITMDVTPGLVVRADRHHVARLLTNLLENARRHTPADGEILVAARRDGAFAEILVADTGEGIPAEHLPHIGEPFYRVDAARTRDKGGTGLGLAICRTIAQAHGGTLTVESTVGEGTKVRVHLPLASQDVPAAREEPRGIGEKLHSG